MIINVLVLSPHVHEYGSKRVYLQNAGVFKLDTSIPAELQELKFIISPSNPNRPFVYINEDQLKDLKDPELEIEYAPELPLSIETEVPSLAESLEKLAAPSIPDQEDVAPIVTPIEEGTYTTIKRDTPQEIIKQEDSILIEEEQIETLPLNVQTVQIGEEVLEDAGKKESRRAYLKSLDWKSIKTISLSLDLEYKDKETAIKQILEKEF